MILLGYWTVIALFDDNEVSDEFTLLKVTNAKLSKQEIQQERHKQVRVRAAVTDTNLAHQNNKRNGVVVLGMHRSGTSMLSGLLVDGCGYHVGAPLIRAGPANPKGFFELLPVVLQNDEFMKKQRVGWNLRVLHYNNEKAMEHKKSGQVDFSKGNRALQFLNNPNNVPWLQKDPRMCITLPTWLNFFNTEPAIVFTYRHPLEVALSLKKRETNFGLEHALRLWIAYNMRAIQHSQGLCRVLTSNNAILRDPLNEVQRISDELVNKCSVPAPPRRLAQEIVNEFVDPELQQQKRKREAPAMERDVILDYNGCKVYDYNSLHRNGTRQNDREMNMYKKAMKIYCDLESGKAYEDDYQWPKI
jgi:hypothetical protein